jgi:nitroimidazol reductase NimA-like FMN-containing flavoprotein (pyridoxamine 5'-phosphate oxidase superfamily)
MTSTWQRVETLEPSECMRLLASVRLGRLAWAGEAGPQVLPVNHSVLEGNIVLRTDLYSTVAEATRSGTVAFEADELDDRLRSGWSVLVLGEAEHVEDPKEMADLFHRMGQPWAPGSRPLVARVVPSQVTGRRFHKT